MATKNFNAEQTRKLNQAINKSGRCYGDHKLA